MLSDINVTKPDLPEIEGYFNYIKGIWERNWLTNHGPLVQELEKKLTEYLGVDFLQFTTNGTIPLQIAIKALELSGEVITTPFSYVATTGAILWENCKPVFVDIESQTFCIDADKIEASITSKTSAILATHVYGFPCAVDKIERIALKYNLKVIYDGAHAFGVKIKGKSIFSFGDISTCSFHATKLFQTVEGGAFITKHKILHDKAKLYKSFGHLGDDYFCMGINGKNSEFHAAMGLCNISRVDDFIQRRKILANSYIKELSDLDINFINIPNDIEYNYSYFPVIFRSESDLLNVHKYLIENKIVSRRYFYPSLNNLAYLDEQKICPISDDISKRILCLPFYQQLSIDEFNLICSVIRKAMLK